VPFAQALEQGKPLKLKNLNEGFQDPQLIVLSYYQASQVVDYLVKTYGEAKLHAFVKSFARGLDTEAALKETLWGRIDQVQTGLDTAFQRDFGPLQKALKKIDIPQNATAEQLAAMAQANPDSFAVHMRLAAGASKGRRRRRGHPRARAGRAAVARVAREIQSQRDDCGDCHRAEEHRTRHQALDAFLKVDGNDVDAARAARATLEPLGDAARTAAAICGSWTRIRSIRTRNGCRTARLAAEGCSGRFAHSVRRSAPSRRTPRWRTSTLRRPTFSRGQNAEAKQEDAAALEVAPSFEPAQELLLKIVGGG
jgi:hypothetical protein